MNISHGHLWLTALIGAAVAAAVVAAAPQLDGPYTAAQVTTGKAIYEQRCADCHRANLEGTGHGPALTGAAFLDVWGSRTAGQLLGFISDSMPPGGSTLGEEEYISVVAYILRSNGHAPGALFDADSMVTVGAPASASNQVAEAASGAPGTQPSEQSESQATNAVLKMRSKSPKKKVQGFTPVTDEMLYHPPASDWLSWRRTLDGQGHSPLDQITRENVSQMRLAWGWTMKNEGSNQTTPLVHDGVMYLVNPGNIVQALDAKTGELIWEYVYTFPRASMVFGGPTRNIAIYRDKLFMSTYDAAIVAIDAKTGTQVWRTVKADYRKGYTQTSGPIIADGVVVSGINGCERFDRDGCFVTGHDPDTGKELWRTSTIALPGDPNTASWGDVPPVLRGGGDTWIAGSYDPELKLFYIGTAQAKPWAAVSRGMSVADAALYTNSTLALDPRTGEMEWYFQHVPGESLDMDMVFERVLVDVNDEKALLTIGKDGVLWKIDRRSGEYINLTETVHQDIYEKVDKEAGRVFYRPDIVQAAIGDTLSVLFPGCVWRSRLAGHCVCARGQRTDHSPAPGLRRVYGAGRRARRGLRWMGWHHGAEFRDARH